MATATPNWRRRGFLYLLKRLIWGPPGKLGGEHPIKAQFGRRQPPYLVLRPAANLGIQITRMDQHVRQHHSSPSHSNDRVLLPQHLLSDLPMSPLNIMNILT